MISVAIACVIGHLPSYGDGTCRKITEDVTVSRVFYSRGSGGVEVHLDSDVSPFNTTSQTEMIDFDIVFPQKYDPSTYDVYVGCQGCADEDAITGSRLEVEYSDGRFEPFTQTAYFSAVRNESERFVAASSLHPDVCPSGHFGIRVVWHGNGTEIVWGAVTGDPNKEEFTVVDYLASPIYILMNHGSRWNDQGWTIFVVTVLSIITVTLMGVAIRACGGWDFVGSGFRVFFNGKCADSQSPLVLAEAFCYDVALTAFFAFVLEIVIHSFYAQADIPLSGGFVLSVFGIAVLLGGGMVAWTVFVYTEMVQEQSNPRQDLIKVSQCLTFGSFIMALLSFILAGAGFFLGPSALFAAAVVRMCHICIKPKRYALVALSVSAPMPGLPVINLRV